MLEWFGEERTAWRFFCVLFMSMLATTVCAVLACFVVLHEPGAASSGIPGVIAFLNGVDLRMNLRFRVLVAKLFGTILVVGSGLVAGPEGPMIHIGAIVGMCSVSHFIRPVLRRMGPRFRTIEAELSRHPLRYDVQCAAMGSGAGVAAAFGAPVAGTLFVVEEASSFFSKRLFWHTFICCASAVATAWMLMYLTGVPIYSFFLQAAYCLTSPVTVMSFVQVATVGCVVGGVAKVFNGMVVELNAWHSRVAMKLGNGPRLKAFRMAEVVIVACITGAYAVGLPLTDACQDASLHQVWDDLNGCITDEMLAMLMKGTKSEGGTVRYSPSSGLFGAQFDPRLCPVYIAKNKDCRLDGIDKFIKSQGLTGKVTADQYCCGFANMTALEQGNFFSVKAPTAPLTLNEEHWPRGACAKERYDERNHVVMPRYSPAAALTLTNPHAMARNLLMHGAPDILSTKSLLLYSPMYILLGAVTSTLALPGGLLVPQMAMGASAGRLVGAVWREVLNPKHLRRMVNWVPEAMPLLEYVAAQKPERDDTPELKPAGTMWTVADSGVFALAGSAAFLSGSGALVLFVIVLLIEITLTPELIPAIVVAVVCARATASFLGSKHGLYHELIGVQSLPLLDEHPHWSQRRWVVKDILTEDLRRQNARLGASRDQPLVITVPMRATAEQVSEALMTVLPGDTEALVNVFPVVDGEGRLCGIVSREKLKSLLDMDLSLLRPIHSGFPDEEPPSLNPEVEMSDAVERSLSDRMPSSRSGEQARLAVEQVMDLAPWVVQEKMPVQHAHMVMRQNGLRHMIVVDLAHHPRGVLTRKSLMPWRAPWRDEGGEHDSYLATREQAHPTGVGA